MIIDPAWCDCPDGYPHLGIGKYKHLPSCRYGIIEDFLGSLTDHRLVSEADLAAALHAAQVRCSPNIPYCRATHKGHAERLFAALGSAQEKGEAG